MEEEYDEYGVLIKKPTVQDTVVVYDDYGVPLKKKDEPVLEGPGTNASLAPGEPSGKSTTASTQLERLKKFAQIEYTDYADKRLKELQSEYEKEPTQENYDRINGQYQTDVQSKEKEMNDVVTKFGGMYHKRDQHKAKIAQALKEKPSVTGTLAKLSGYGVLKDVLEYTGRSAFGTLKEQVPSELRSEDLRVAGGTMASMLEPRSNFKASGFESKVITPALQDEFRRWNNKEAKGATVQENIQTFLKNKFGEKYPLKEAEFKAEQSKYRLGIEKEIQAHNKEYADIVKDAPQDISEVDAENVGKFIGSMAGQGFGRIIPSLLTAGGSSIIAERSAVFNEQLDKASEKTGLSREEIISQGLDHPESGRVLADFLALSDIASVGNIASGAGKKVLRKAVSVAGEALQEAVQGEGEAYAGAKGAGAEYEFSANRAATGALGGLIGASAVSAIIPTGTADGAKALQEQSAPAINTIQKSIDPNIPESIDQAAAAIEQEVNKPQANEEIKTEPVAAIEPLLIRENKEETSPEVQKQTEEQTSESQTINKPENAIQEQSASSVLQHPQEGVGEEGSSGSGMERSQSGTETTGTQGIQNIDQQKQEEKGLNDPAFKNTIDDLSSSEKKLIELYSASKEKNNKSEEMISQEEKIKDLRNQLTINTSDIFQLPLQSVPKIDRKQKSEIQEIDVSQIAPSQPTVRRGYVENKDQKYVPTVIRNGDQYIIDDGHHRIADAVMRGNKTVKANVKVAENSPPLTDKSVKNVSEQSQVTSESSQKVSQDVVASEGGAPAVPSSGTSTTGKMAKSGAQTRTFEPLSEDKYKNEVANVVAENPVFYEKENSEGIVAKAKANIVESGGFDAHYDTLTKKASLDDIPVRQVERMMAMYHYGNQLSEEFKNGADQKTIDFLYERINNLQEITSLDGVKTGQGSWVFSLWKSLDPSAWVGFFNKKIEKSNAKQLEKKGIDGKTIGKKIDESLDLIKKAARDAAVSVTESDDFNSILERIINKKIGQQKSTAEQRKNRIKEVNNKLKEAENNLKNEVATLLENLNTKHIVLDQNNKSHAPIIKLITDYITALINKIAVESGESIKNLDKQVRDATNKFLSSIGVELKETDFNELVNAKVKEFQSQTRYTQPITEAERIDAVNRLVDIIMPKNGEGKRVKNTKPAIQQFYGRLVARIGEEDKAMAKKAPVDILKEVVGNIDKYSDVLQGIKDDLQSKGVDVSDVNSLFNLPFFEKQIQKQVVIDDIKALINSSFEEKEATNKSIADKIVAKYGLSPSDAKVIQEIVTKKVNAKVKEASEKEMTRIYGTTKLPSKKKTSDVVDKITKAVNLGALDKGFYQQLFNDHFGLIRPMTAEESNKLRSLAKAVHESDSYFERMAILDMAQFMAKLYPNESKVDTFFALAYASMLSGVTTTSLNLYSTGSNVVGKPIRDVLNVSKWIRAARKGIKNKSLGDFYEFSPLAETLYVPQVMGFGASKGATAFKEIWANGDIDNKYVEMMKRDKSFKISPLETHKYGENRFKPVYINIPKVGKVDLNFLNKYKYSMRNLSAQDKLMFTTMNEFYTAISIRNNYMEKGLRGKELRKAVMDDVLGRSVDMNKIYQKLEKDIKNYEDNTGNKLTERQINLHKQLLIRDALTSITTEQKQTSEDLARDNTFTYKRGGLVANLANELGGLINKNPATAIAIKPHIPFTQIVGNVFEASMDATPFYGFARANGLGFTGLYNKINISLGADPINTSQLGEKGSDKYYEQMGRAWAGTIAFTVVASLFLSDDDDDNWLDITGGHVPQSLQKSHPPYTINIGDFSFSYLNIPVLAIPLSIIGNYKDRRRFGDKSSNAAERFALAVALDTPNMLKDMSFVSGIQNLTEMISEALTLQSNKVKYVGKELYKKYFGFATKPLPQNTALLQQSEKFFDPTSYSAKTISEITAYSLGAQMFANHPNIDVFGQEIKTYPGESLIPYTHWFNIREKDPKWEFLYRNGITVNKIKNVPVAVFNNDTQSIELRTLEPEEYYKYCLAAGQNFAVEIQPYLQMKGNLQKEIDTIWSAARTKAREDLFASKFDKMVDKQNTMTWR